MIHFGFSCFGGKIILVLSEVLGPWISGYCILDVSVQTLHYNNMAKDNIPFTS